MLIIAFMCALIVLAHSHYTHTSRPRVTETFILDDHTIAAIMPAHVTQQPMLAHTPMFSVTEAVAQACESVAALIAPVTPPVNEILHDTLDTLDEVDLALARLAAECEAERASKIMRAHSEDACEDFDCFTHPIDEAERIMLQPVVSANMTMPAYKRLREARKAAGLTVRGTVPLPTCGAPTKNGGTCKNRKQYDDTIDALVGCDWHTCAVTPIYTSVSV